MGERDAFGREKDEDTLQEMGWRADLSPDAPKPQPVKPASVQWTAPKPEPATAEQATRVIVESAGAASPWAAAASAGAEGPAPGPGGAPAWGGPAAMPRRRRMRRRGGGFSRLIFFGVLIVIIAATTGSLIKIGQDTIDKGTRAIRGALPTPTTQAKIPSQATLVKASALSSVLKQLPDGRLKSLRVSPDAIDAQVVADGKLTMVHVTRDGDMTTLKAPVSLPGKSLKIDPAAPARIIRKAHKHQADLNYMVVTGIAGTPTWQAFFSDGSHYTANLSGSQVHKLGS